MHSYRNIGELLDEAGLFFYRDLEVRIKLSQSTNVPLSHLLGCDHPNMDQFLELANRLLILINYRKITPKLSCAVLRDIYKNGVDPEEISICLDRYGDHLQTKSGASQSQRTG